jgi:hypothetical protein
MIDIAKMWCEHSVRNRLFQRAEKSIFSSFFVNSSKNTIFSLLLKSNNPKFAVEETEPSKKRISFESQIGLAALIASVAIPLAQFFVGYFEQRTIQQQNTILEQERRRIEITKMFMENYVGKKPDVQIATIRIMKTLDPDFFISIEEGLNETTSSDSVKATLRKATVEAATEIGSNSTNLNKNKKVQRVLSAKEFENKGYDLLLKGDFKNAEKSFQQANQHYPTYISIEEFNKKYPDAKMTEFSEKDSKKGNWKSFFKNKSSKSDTLKIQ